MESDLTWVKVPVREVGIGHLGRYLRASDGAVSTEGTLVAFMHGLMEPGLVSQLVVETETGSVVQINTAHESDEVELSMEKAR